MKKIQLIQGKYALVDDEDFEYLNQWKWEIFKNRSGNLYVIRRIYIGEKHKSIRMHREIMNPLKNEEIDHKNHNGLDNRRSNLRICNHSQNMMNRIMLKRNKSGYTGVYFNKNSLRKNPWIAQITINKKAINLGYFRTAHQAAIARDLWAKDLYGEFASLNFKSAI